MTEKSLSPFYCTYLVGTPKYHKAPRQAGSAWECLPFLTSWSAQVSLFQHIGERVRLFREMMQVYGWRREHTDCAEQKNASFNFDATSLMLWLEQTWLAVPDAFRESAANHNAPRSLLSHLCAYPKSLQGPVPVCLQAGTAAVIVTFKSGFYCYWSTSSFAVLSLSSRRCWYW